MSSVWDFYLLTHLVAACAPFHFTVSLIATVPRDFPSKYAAFYLTAVPIAGSSVRAVGRAGPAGRGHGGGCAGPAALPRLSTARRKERSGGSSTEPNHTNAPTATEMGTAPVPHPGKGPPDQGPPRRGAAPTAPGAGTALGATAALSRSTALPLGTDCREGKKQAIKQIHAHLKEKLQSDL